MYSDIIAGTMRWGVWGANYSLKEVRSLIDVCLENDITTFDHADIYGGYTTEKLFGDAFKEMSLLRNQVQFISKCGIQLPSDEKEFRIKSYNYSKDYIINSVNESLKNLKTDYLDLLLLHRSSPLMDAQEIAAAFSILRSSGKVLDFGVSNFSVSQFELIYQYFPYLMTNQIEVSVNQTDSFYNGVLDQLVLKKLRPMAWSVMGNYFSKDSLQNKRLRTIIKSLAQKYNLNDNQLLLAFVLKHPSKIRTVIGTTKSETIIDLKKSLAVELEIEDWFAVLQASLGREVD